MKKQSDWDVDTIIQWIIENHENTAAIDKINKVTFPFTSKYLNFSERETRQKAPQIDDNFNTTS
jgi:hypothetical protein